MQMPSAKGVNSRQTPGQGGSKNKRLDHRRRAVHNLKRAAEKRTYEKLLRRYYEAKKPFRPKRYVQLTLHELHRLKHAPPKKKAKALAALTVAGLLGMKVARMFSRAAVKKLLS